MGFEYLLSDSQTCTLLLAPPAWGKTYRLRQWFNKCERELLVYVAPLRALADEVEESLEQQFRVCNLKNGMGLEHFIEGRDEQKRVLIITPERVGQPLMNWLGEQKSCSLFFGVLLGRYSLAA